MMDFLAHHAGLIGLIFFFVFFCANCLWVFRPGTKALYKNFSRIPLEENRDER